MNIGSNHTPERVFPAKVRSGYNTYFKFHIYFSNQTYNTLTKMNGEVGISLSSYQNKLRLSVSQLWEHHLLDYTPYFNGHSFSVSIAGSSLFSQLLSVGGPGGQVLGSIFFPLSQSHSLSDRIQSHGFKHPVISSHISNF